MSTVVVPRKRRTYGNFWLPLGIAVALFVADAVILSWPPSDSLSGSIRFLLSVVLDGLGIIVLLGWWVFLSEARLWLRLAPPVIVIALAVASFLLIDEIQINGDMVPVYAHFRWQPTRAALLGTYLESHPATASESVPAIATAKEEVNLRDFPCYRNRNRDGVVVGPPLARDWKARPPRELWRRPCGAGFAGIAAVAGRVVTIEQRGGDEAIVCYNAATGNELWSHSYPARFYDARGGEGPMATPTIDRGLVFSLGGTGRLVCLDLKTGKLNWGKDLLKEKENLIWGMSGSPLVYDDVVVVSPGGQNGRGDGQAVIAFDRKTGERVWGAGSTQAGYASPMLATFEGNRQIVIFDGGEIAGYDAAGKNGKLWSSPWVTNLGINAAQPLVFSTGRVFVTSGYGVGCGLIRVLNNSKASDSWSAEEVARSSTLQGKFASPVEYQGQIYGLNEGRLVCIDKGDLTRRWSGRRYGHGQLLRCEDLLVILSEGGELALVQAAAEKSTELGSIKALPGNKTWNYPCLADGKAYIRNHIEIACYDLQE